MQHELLRGVVLGTDNGKSGMLVQQAKGIIHNATKHGPLGS